MAAVRRLCGRHGRAGCRLGGSVTTTMGYHPCERRFAVVRIEPEATVADAAAALDAGRFDHDQRRAGIGEHAEMIEMPVGGHAVVGAVLAHGRDDDPIREFEIGELDAKKTGHWSWSWEEVQRWRDVKQPHKGRTIRNGATGRKRWDHRCHGPVRWVYGLSWAAFLAVTARRDRIEGPALSGAEVRDIGDMAA